MSTIKDIAKIRVTYPHLGGAKVSLPIFMKGSDNTAIPFGTAIIYGLNGSGKSTLARALASFNRDEQNTFELLDSENRTIDVNDDTTISVFNDDFINANVTQLKGEGNQESLHPIVLIGDSASAKNDIETLETDLESLIPQLEEAANQKSSRESNLKSLTNSISKQLKSNERTNINSWRTRTDKYDPKQNLTKTIKNEIFNAPLISSEEYPKQLARFQEIINQINNISQAKPISIELSEVPTPTQIAETNTLLSDDLSPDKIIINDVSRTLNTFQYGIDELTTRLTGTLSKDSEVCPECFQAISDNFREQARKAISAQIQSLKSSTKLTQLKSCKLTFSDQYENLTQYIKNSIDFSEYTKAFRQLSNLADEYNSLIDTKLSRPSTLIDTTNFDFKSAINELNQAIRLVNETIDEHNESLTMVDHLTSEAQELNAKLSRFEVDSTYSDYLKKANEYNNDVQKLENLQKKFDNLQKSLNEAKGRLSGHTGAISHINRLLKVVYGADTIQLRDRGDDKPGYSVLNRGNIINPRLLSTGEKNILALCYFFVKTVENYKFEEKFGNNQLILLDDPISSFDFDNKYGVISLISLMLKKLLYNNTIYNPNSSKVIILTHDIIVANELILSLKGMSNGNHTCWKLDRSGDINHFSPMAFDIYKENLAELYAFATCENPSDDISSIGNKFRRVWEGFSSFELGEQRITDVLTSKKVRTLLGSTEKVEISNFLESFAARPYINADSHANFQILAEDIRLLPSLSPNNYQRFIRQALAFIHIVSPNHIPGRLAANADQASEYLQSMDTLVSTVINE